MGLNYIAVSGYIAQEPTLRHIKTNGVSVVNFTIAVNNYYQEELEWLKCEFWGVQAENFVKHYKQGDFIELEGKLKTVCYKNAENKEIEDTKVVVQKTELVKKKEIR